jgi:hypothetical protein
MLPVQADADRERPLAGALQLAGQGFTAPAEQYLLRAFFGFTVPEGTGYDLAAEPHTRLGDTQRAAWWRSSADRLLARRTTTTTTTATAMTRRGTK